MPTEWMLPTELELRRRGLRPLNTDLANDVLISHTRKLLAEKEKEQKEEKERWTHMTHSQMLGKFEYTRGPIFKVVLEC